MSSIRRNLALMKKEESRWVKTNSIDIDSVDGAREQSYSGRRFAQIDTSIIRRMLHGLSGTVYDVAMLFADECDRYTNLFYGTYEEIEERAKISNGSVGAALSELQRIDFIRKIRNSKYMVNPAACARCGEKYFNKLMDTYYSLRPYEPEKKKGKEKLNAD